VVTVTNELAEFVTVQAQPVWVFTVKVALAPAPAMLNVEVEMEKLQTLFAGGTTSVGELGVFFEHAETATDRQINADNS
jgi:hypothetical protein